MKDPPGGKDEPTTSPDVADDSLAVLDQIVADQGPFAAILGYSQGAAFVPVYLAHTMEQEGAQPFDKALMFCGYPTDTHLGLRDDLVAVQSPFGDVPSFHWIGLRDFIIRPFLSRELLPYFTDPVSVEDPTGFHAVPQKNSPTFDDVVAFVRDGATPPPRDDDDEEGCADDPDFAVEGREWIDCDWIAENAVDLACSRSYRGVPIAESCPVACGVCADDGGDNGGACADDPDFLYQNQPGQDCATWVAANPNSRCFLFTRGQFVSDFCRLTCGKC